MKPRHLNAQEWDEVRLEYETSRERPTLRQLADKHGVSRSTIFKRAAREKWTQNAKVVEAARKQIVKKMEAATSKAAQLVAKEIVEDLRPWIQRQKAEHIKRAVAMGKRGFERIERLWDEKEPVDPKQESFAAATLDRHDDMVRRNLGMNETQDGTGALNLNVLSGGRAIVQIAPELPEQAPTLPVGESISPERRAME